MGAVSILSLDQKPRSRLSVLDSRLGVSAWPTWQEQISLIRRHRAAAICCQRGENDADEPVLRCVAVSDRSDRRSSRTGHLPICHGGAVFGLALRERMDRLQGL